MPVKTNNFPFCVGFVLEIEFGGEEGLDFEDLLVDVFFEEALFALVDLAMQKTMLKRNKKQWCIKDQIVYIMRFT